MTVFRAARGRAARCGENKNGCEKPTSQLDTHMERNVIEEIRNFLEWGGGTLVRDHQVGFVGLAAAVLTHAVAFFVDYPTIAFGAAVLWGLDF